MQNRWFKLALTLFMLFGLASNVLAKDWSSVRICSEGAYPPFNSIDSSGNLVGFDIEIGKALCAKMHVKCDFVAQDWDGIIPALLANKYDAIIASMFITEKRKKKVAFTDPYYKAAMTLVVPKDSALKQFTVDSMAGKIIGAQSGTTQAEYMTKTFTKSNMRLYVTQDAVNLDLASGRLDAQVGDMLPMLDWIEKSDDGKCCKLIGKPITDPAFVGDGVGIAVRLEDDDLRKMLNKALKEIIADGTYKTINDKFFSIDVYSMK